MANRFPLVLDTGDGNKIKELPSGDNLNLRESSIVNVQDIDALGTINAADITVNGNRLVAQTFADLTDTPNTFAGAADYFVKVKEDGTGLEFRPFSDIGNIEVERIEVSDTILPTADNTVDIGNSSLRFRTVTAREFKGDLLANDNTRVFDATTGFVSYAALQGAPQFLSEFTDDIGFLRTSDLDDGITGNVKGSVFGDDSTVLVDAVNNTIPGTLTGDWNNPGNTFDIVGSGLNISTPSSALSFSTTGLSTAFSNGTDNSAYTFSDTGSSLAFSDGVDSTTLSITPSAISLATTGNITVASSGSVTYSIVGDLSISSNNFTLNTNGVIADLTGDVTGNIDNASLTIGATTATTISIGNPTSTIEINGTIEFADALIVNNITADDSIIIRTLGNTANEAITIRAFGTDNAVNLTADSIRFFGPITTEIIADGGITGDIKGSVFGDDSSVMVDAVNSTMFSNAMTLTPLNAEPAELIAGMLVAADGVNWDPASKVGAVPYPVFYDGVIWNALY